MVPLAAKLSIADAILKVRSTTIAMPPADRACAGRNNLPIGFLFRGFNFRGSLLNRENRENWIPQKNSSYRYTH